MASYWILGVEGLGVATAGAFVSGGTVVCTVSGTFWVTGGVETMLGGVCGCGEWVRWGECTTSGCALVAKLGFGIPYAEFGENETLLLLTRLLIVGLIVWTTGE